MALRTLLLATLLPCYLATPTIAQQLILDEEFTQTCRRLTAPLQKTLATGTDVHYVLVADPDINAFVTGENIIFINSGLIAKAKSAAELQGVLAHELGHVQARHILQKQGQMRQAGMGAIAGAVLGIGAAVAGAPQVGSAIMMGSQAGAISQMLAYSRTQEQEADHYAVQALHNAGYSSQGMVDMFSTLRAQSQLSYDAPPEWLVTHPLPPERLSNLQNVVAQEVSGLKKQPEEINFERLQAKVMALTESPGAVTRHYGTTSSGPGAYARALSLLHGGRLKEAEAALAPLLAATPDDPYYQEAAGQLALEQSNLKKAEEIFAKLVAAHPNWLLVRYQYAEVLRAQNQPAKALAQYERITSAWPAWSEPWEGQGLVYGQLGRLAESHLSLSEAALMASDPLAAEQSLKLARHYLKEKPNPDQQIWAESLENRLKTLKRNPNS